MWAIGYVRTCIVELEVVSSASGGFPVVAKTGSSCAVTGGDFVGMIVGETEIEAELAAAGTGSEFDGNALDLIDVVDDLIAAGSGGMIVGETGIEGELAAAGTGSDFDGNSPDLIDVVDDLVAAGNGEVAEVAWGSVLDDIAPSWEAAAAEHDDKEVVSAAVAVVPAFAAVAAVAVQAVAAAVVALAAFLAHVDISFPSSVVVGLAPPISSSFPPPIAAVVVVPARFAPGPLEPAASAAP